MRRRLAAMAVVTGILATVMPAEAKTHATLGYVWHYDLRWMEAEREFRRALVLNPSYALARIWYANC